LVVDPVSGEAATLWGGFSRGEPAATERLLSLHYGEFRQVARRVLNGDGQKLQIQPTDLAHEAAIRLMRLDRIALTDKDRTHFMALSARVMRQVLLDEVRRFRALKRQKPVIETAWINPGSAPAVLDIEAFDRSLEKLEAVDPDKARLVEQRFFAGLTLEEIAAESGVSLSTVKRQWRTARAWLLADLAEDA
jgi:RNA polymerase sigma factor (TIGR02999 family)